MDRATTPPIAAPQPVHPSTYFQHDSASPARHIRFLTPPALLCPSSSPPGISLPLGASRRVGARVDAPSSALAILAAVCSSPSVRWDGRKHHYTEDSAKTVWHEDASHDNDAPRHAHIVEPSSPTPALTYGQRSLTLGDRIREDMEAYEGSHIRKAPVAEEIHFPADEDDEDYIAAPRISGALDYFSDFTPSSPTTLSLSSPRPRMSYDFFSSSERSATLPLSSPAPPSPNKHIITAADSQSFVNVEVDTVSRDVYEASSADSAPLEFKVEPIELAMLSDRPEGHNVSESKVIAMESVATRSRSLSPLHVPGPLPRPCLNIALSPLSSVLSSPLSEVECDGPFSPTVSRFSISSSALSSRSASPDVEIAGGNKPTRLKPTGRRASTHITGTDARPIGATSSIKQQQRSDTAPPEPTPRKRRRLSSPSSGIVRAFQVRRVSSPHSPTPSHSKRATTSSAGHEENRRAGRKPKARNKQALSSASVSSSKGSEFRDFEASVAHPHFSQPRKRGKANPSDARSKGKAPSDATATLTQEPSSAELAALPMTGFLVETLALSRASAMAAPELLRAVLKSQPHLMEEQTEKSWLASVRHILERVRMFGRIERQGTDAADRPLEDQWFYIPENDEEDGRAELLKGLMPTKRDVTKRSKQYYFEPVQKVSRWDPEDD